MNIKINKNKLKSNDWGWNQKIKSSQKKRLKAK